MTPLDAIAGKFLHIDGAMPGVYLLVRGDAVLYVGSSEKVIARIGAHVGCGIRFDRALWLPLPKQRLKSVEGALMRFFDPPYNLRCPPPDGGDAPILQEFGLPPHADEAAVFAMWHRRNRAPSTGLGRFVARRNRLAVRRMRATSKAVAQ